MALQHHSWEYRTNPEGGNDIPDLTNDRYYAQDRVRDYWAPIDQVSRALSAMTNGANVKLRGDDIVQGSSPTLISVPVQFGVVRYQVTVPGSFASSLPPTADTETIFVPVETTEQLDVSLASATLDGSTTNYVKIAYAETDGPTRTRAKISGSYVYEKTPSFTLTIDATAPTDFELSVATFTGDGTNPLVITQQNETLLALTMDQPVKTTDDVTFTTVRATTMGTRERTTVSLANLGDTHVVPAGRYIITAGASGGDQMAIEVRDPDSGNWFVVTRSTQNVITGLMLDSDGTNVRGRVAGGQGDISYIRVF